MGILLEKLNTLEAIHQLAFNSNFAFVSYSLPNTNSITTMVQCNSEPAVLSTISELKGRSGFVFAPFDLKSKFPIRLIEPDHIINNDASADTFLDLYKNVPISKKGYGNICSDLDEVKKDVYISQVDDLRITMLGGLVDKVVLSRISIDDKPKNFNSSRFFQQLQSTYPDAFVYMIYLADSGIWFGATPEPLFRVKNGVATTVSLAGTRLFSANSKVQAWDEKEMEEQEIVTDYIEEILSDFKIVEYTKQGPTTKMAGAVEHLLTKFSFSFSSINDKLVEFLDALHPTPSVCGLPKDLAFGIIKRVEKHSREYYTGFLGLFDVDNEYNLFVNLRCLREYEDKLIYFLGAGITVLSHPDDEWEETNSKKKTLMNIVESLKAH